ncbi:MAG: chromate efflux transporter [Paracoccaceae bacterium]|nr:MAG: chromate efflux transporter [Paracoccaceae bacterium]
MTETHRAAPTLADVTQVFGRIGVTSFGGPAAQIAMMHHELVDRRHWLTEAEYLRALSFCMMLPGPEAMQLATYAGWRLHGTAGGLIAGLLFVAPGALVVLALAMAYAAFGQVPLVAALFAGVQAAVLAIVLHALLRVARKALHTGAHWVLAALAFAALFLFNLPFPVVVAAAALWGLVTTRGAAVTGPPLPPQALRAAIGRIAIWGAVWLVPLAALGLAEGGLLWEIGLFFSQLAVMTFGGAYAVLAWMTQAVVHEKGWLSLQQMIDALGLAETTPGPLILVTEFVGYLAGHRAGGVWLGAAGAATALWMTFAPCFLWIFAGAPFVERLATAPRLSGALAAITAAVVGVIANLSVWFALHVVFARVGLLQAGPLRVALPDPSSIDLVALALGLIAGWLILVRHAGILATLALCAGLSGAISFLV